MKTLSHLKLPLLALIFSIFLIPHLSEAKGQDGGQWSKTEPNPLAYFWNCSSSAGCYRGATGWEKGLSAPQVTVDYYADIYDDTTNTIITDGTSVAVGSTLRFVPKPYNDADTNWFAYGFTQDSPNGHWISGAAAPTFGCNNGDISNTNITDDNGNVYNTYSPLSINPPVNSLDLTSSTASLINISPNVYKVNSAGTIVAKFIFASTNGEFYYRYKMTSKAYSSLVVGTCYGNQTAMETITSATPPPFCISIMGSPCSTEWTYTTADYSLQVPEQTVTFTLTATGGNTAPAAPTINNQGSGGSTSGTANQPITFTFTATDPDIDTIKYGIDWDNIVGVDEWVPTSGFVNSGTSQATTHPWPTSGTYTFQALTQDSNGLSSGWTTHTVVVSPAPAPTASLTINNSTGPLNVPKNTSVNIQWSSTNAVSCSKWGGTWGNGETIATSGTDTTVVTTSSTYLVNCGGTVSQVQVNVVNQTPNPPSITYQSGTLQTGQPITFSIQGSDPDTDNIFYEVDWDNDGTPEATSMTVPSNTAQPATHSWTTAGIQTFQARTVDLSGARSTWTPHSETITLAIPNPPASITATCPLPGDTLTAAWSATPGATSYNLRVDNQSNTWDSSCNPSNTPGDYCQDGLTSTSKVVTGTPNATHNLWVHACNAAGCSAPVTIASPVTCVQRPNFTQPAITYTLSPFNTTTGFYDYIDVTFQNTNGGGSNTQANADYQFRYDAGQNGYELTRTGALGLFTVGQSVNKTERVLNVTFGPTRIEVTADNTNAVAETNEADNVRTLDFTVPPPDPGLTITADRVRVRNDETTTIRWNTTTTYPGLTCQVYGPGTNLNPATLPGTVTTQPIKAKSEYTFKCTEATTGTVWSKVATVETEGVIEER